jgi:hypothetical protein
VQLHKLITWALDTRERVTSGPNRLTDRENPSVSFRTGFGTAVSIGAGLDRVVSIRDGLDRVVSIREVWTEW